MIGSDQNMQFKSYWQDFFVEQVIDRMGRYYNNGKLDPRLPEELD